MRDYLELNFGFGSFEVMEGSYNDKYALIIGKNGNGIIGESISKDRYLNKDEILSVFTFENVSSVDVVIEQLNKLKYNMENKLPFYVKNEYGDVIDIIKPTLG